MYLIAAIAVLTVRGSFRALRDGPATSIRADIGEGLRYLRSQPLLRRLGLLTGARLITFSAVGGVLAVYAVAPGPMGLSATGYGFFVAATAIGAVLSSITGERLVARVGAARCLHLTMLAFAVTELSPLAVNPFAVGALWMVGTYFVIIWNVVTLSVRQRVVPEHLLGRVNSAYRVVSWGAAPVGALLGGILAELTSIRITFVICAVATAFLALGTLPLTDEDLAAGALPIPEVPDQALA
jgi:predicted MFS family arabinose efflux permease